ncbi:MAG: hypothetical protein HY567_02260 [Candidatus Kerfeldbacteria bacterium]|nr:hypothetical protein [Candidatus Kerfeldbacteria bacterium]
MECLANGRRAKARQLLLRAVGQEPDYMQTYVGLTAVYEEEGKKKKARECINLAFQLTRKKFQRWPKEMHWGYIENRQFLRAIANKATAHHEDGEHEAAEKLYRLILKLNPNDNQGIRYLLAGLYAGIGPNDVNEYMEEGNRTQNWSKIEKLLTTQNAKRHFWKEPSG